MVECIIACDEAGADGPDARFIVTNLKGRNARVLYEDVYCQRGQAENQVKSWKSGGESHVLHQGHGQLASAVPGQWATLEFPQEGGSDVARQCVQRGAPRVKAPVRTVAGPSMRWSEWLGEKFGAAWESSVIRSRLCSSSLTHYLLIVRYDEQIIRFNIHDASRVRADALANLPSRARWFP
jgi:Transposase DDE domain group 1